MHVAILLNARFPTEKAYGIQVLAMARGFRDAGIRVSVIYPRRSDEIPIPEEGISFIPFGWKLSLWWPGMFHLIRWLGARQVVQTLADCRPDILLVNDPVQAEYVSRQATYRVIWDIHDIPNLSKPSRKRLIQRILRQAKGIVSTNQLKIDTLRKEFGILPPVKILPNPPAFDIEVYRSIERTPARKKLGLTQEAKVLVYAGQLFDWKGVDTLIQSAAFAPTDVQIHIIGGKGADLERCQKIAAALPTESSAKVFLHGQQPPEAIPTWLRAADLVAIPNSGKFEVSRRDTNPMKLQEALAAAIPVLASNLPSIRQSVPESEAIQFVPADDVQAWGRAIQHYFDPMNERARHMQQAARRISWIRSPKERAKELGDFFQDLI